MSNSLVIIVITLVVYGILQCFRKVYSSNRQHLINFFSIAFKAIGRFFSWILEKLRPSLRDAIVSKISAINIHVSKLWAGWVSSISPKRKEKFSKWKEAFNKISDNLAVGLVIAAVMFVLHSFPILSDIEDAGMDLMMQARQKLIPAIREKNIPSFVFLDIDDETYRNWKEPLLTPRKELTKLIDIAVRGDASLIIVDFDLSQKIPAEDGKELHTEDESLKTYLVNYAKGCKSKPMCPSIILVRAFHTPEQVVQPVSLLESFKSLENFKLFLRPPLKILEPRIGFLEEKTDVEFKPYVLWASANFFRSPYDQVVRRWELWQSTCLNKQQPGITYSIELLATSIIRNCTAERGLKKLDEALKDFQPKPENCTDGSLVFSPSREIPKEVDIGELTVSTDRKDTRQRILYSIPGESTLLVDEENEHIFRRFSASFFSAEPLSSEAEEIVKYFENKVVFIGGSYGEGRDSHLTPLGQMPGALVVINAIHSLLQYETIEPVSLGLKLLLEAVFIVIISILFRMFSSFLGMLVSGIVIISILLPMSVVFFEYGIWLDFALPLLAVVLHRMMEDFKGDENKGEEETKVVMRKIVVRTGLKPFRTRRTKRPLP